MTVSALIRELLDADPTVTDDAAADRVIATASTRDELVDLVRPLVAGEVRHERRARTRTLERQVYPPEVTRPASGAGQTVDPTELRRAWLAERIALDDGRIIPWGDATAADLELRIAYLRRQRDGIDRSMAVVQRVIAELRASGARTVAELDNALEGVAA